MLQYVTVFCLFTNNVISDIVNNKFVYNDNKRIMFSPPSPAEYFGYSVFLTDTADKLIIGAPKANSTFNSKVNSGRVYSCPIRNDSSNNSTCIQLQPQVGRRFDSTKFLTNNMQFGATVGAIKDKLVFACGPTWAEPYRDTHLLTVGACYAFTTTGRNQILQPLKGSHAISSPGFRQEYKEYGTVLNYYAYGLAGLAMKITEDSNVLLGAPGILQNTGSIVDYYILEKGPTIRRQPIANPYYTVDLGPDDYFGYSVDSAVFEPKGKFLQVGGAPRSKMGLGQVLVIEPAITETSPLKVRSRLIGPQVGSYFGAALCCVDVNGDGRTDMLVGAPNYVKNDVGFNYDQGAVFVYINREKNSTFVLEESTYVFGNGASGARFGSSIASLGDIDGDGYNDVAIGAPWEDNGVVYIYRGSESGLKSNYVQRITAEGARGFGMSISKGQDVDHNFCNDVAIGAHASGSAYLYRCTPTIKVDASIMFQNISDLPENPTNFTAFFCLTVRPQKYTHVKLEVQAIKTVDADLKRATIEEDTTTVVSLKPGIDQCDEHVIVVNTTTDLTKPIPVSYELKLMTSQDSARLSEDSVLQASSLFQMMFDCGKDMICTPLLSLTLKPLDSPYIPGTDQKLGTRVNVTNHGEPAYGIKFNLTLPRVPKRVPTSCILQNLNMTCSLPALFRRNDTAQFEIELDYEQTDNYEDLVVTAEMLYENKSTVEELTLKVHPVAHIAINGKALPNVTVAVSREVLYAKGNVSFVHYYQITNFGPSNWYHLKADLIISDQINLSSPVVGCTTGGPVSHKHCAWDIPAKHTISVVLPLQLDLNIYGNFLEDKTVFKATSAFYIVGFEKDASVTTNLVLDPTPPLWPWIVAIIGGILLLALIIFILYKLGFFSRPKKDDLKRLLEDKSLEQEPRSSDGLPTAPEVSSASTAAERATAEDCDTSQFDASTLEFEASTMDFNASDDASTQELIELDSD